jgi:hypothetical protein
MAALGSAAPWSSFAPADNACGVTSSGFETPVMVSSVFAAWLAEA